MYYHNYISVCGAQVCVCVHAHLLSLFKLILTNGTHEKLLIITRRHFSASTKIQLYGHNIITN